MSKDLITIIVPVFNAEKELSKMLDSILDQSYPYWEMILVNDGSVDDSQNIIESYVLKDERFRAISQNNAGPSVARNMGIDLAKGDYLTFIDADDWVSKDYLEKLLFAMLHSSADLVCGGYFEVNNQFKEGISLHDFSNEQFNKKISKQSYQANLFNNVSGVLWAKLFKTEIFRKNNIQLNPKLNLSEDLIVVLRYSTFIETAYILPYPIYYYNRLHDTGLSSQFTFKKYQNLKVLINEINKYRSELSFLDLDKVINIKKYQFMTIFLKDQRSSKNKFYAASDLIVQSELSLDQAIFQTNKINNKILKWVFQGKYLKSWILINFYHFLRSI